MYIRDIIIAFSLVFIFVINWPKLRHFDCIQNGLPAYSPEIWTIVMCVSNPSHLSGRVYELVIWFATPVSDEQSWLGRPTSIKSVLMRDYYHQSILHLWWKSFWNIRRELFLTWKSNKIKSVNSSISSVETHFSREVTIFWQ